jgi:glycosyltransferase involved in cell wall biosynthesis
MIQNSNDISGFTFIKNGISLGYPIKESIESIEPLCKEIIINVGFDNPELKDDDGTYEYLRDHFSDSKYIFFKSWWDPKVSSEGLILSEQTNIALEKCKGKYCQYIQGDEAIHEDDLVKIENGIKKMEINEEIKGLIFNYLHFYGNVDILKYTRNVYRREVRLIRNHSGIKSWKDAQGFRSKLNTKIKATLIPARVFHYGWARQEQIMNKKVQKFEKLYHGEEFENQQFNYERIWGLKEFKETHPKMMNNWIEKNRNSLDIMSLPIRNDWRNLGLFLSDTLENLTGYRIGEYKNYIKI